ncbi:MAG TPA: class I adenylate-forming enzyme family protein [Acidimicrobiales bacterium]
MLDGTLRAAAERWGQTPAYVATQGWAVSYADLDRLAGEVAVGLAERGLGEGDVLALVLPPTPEYLVAYLAAARLGATTAGVNGRLTPDERRAVLARAGAAMVLATPDLAPTGDAVIVVERAAGKDDLLTGVRVPGADVPAPADDPDRPVAIVFTSGTTGLPKGAVFAGRQLQAITDIDVGTTWGGGGATMAGTSFAHLGPMTKLPGVLRRGGTTHLMDHWRAEDALGLIERHRLGGIGGIPTQVALMLRHPRFDTTDVSSVQAVIIGGGPATAALVREARERFGCALSVRYSCTEAGIGLGTAFDAPLEDAELSVGRPHPGVELTIRSGDEVLAGGEEGEVCLRSPAAMVGYHQDPVGTREAFTDDGAVRTGDIGYVDPAGRLRLVGRSKERYVRGGYNVYPVEIEQVLAEHPAVAEVAVAPRPDDVMGEVGVAVVVPVAGASVPSVDDLQAFAGDRLARYKLPSAVVSATALPLTAAEKLDRGALRRMVEGA